MRVIFSILFLAAVIFGYSQNKGSLFTKITDAATGETLAGVSVTINGVGSFNSDFDGNLNLPEITPGIYTITCSFLSYSDKVIKAEIQNGEINFLKIELEDPLTSGIPTASASTVSLSSQN